MCFRLETIRQSLYRTCGPQNLAVLLLLLTVCSFRSCSKFTLDPGVYARVHEERNWIRFQVCRLSDNPPDYFDCDNGPVTLSPMPTSTPTAPTASPNPTSESLDVLLRIDMDWDAQDTGWSIEEVDTGNVVAGVPVGGYESSQRYDIVLEPLSLQQGVEYTLTLLDGLGDGLYGQGKSRSMYGWMVRVLHYDAHKTNKFTPLYNSLHLFGRRAG